MLEFFFFLFGGLYLIIRYTGSKLRAQEQDKHSNALASAREKIRVEYDASYEEQVACQNKILDGKHYDEICEKLQDDLHYVFGEQWQDILDIPPKPITRSQKDRGAVITNHTVHIPTNHTFWVYHLLLAHMGKLEWFQAMFGYTAVRPYGARFVKRIEQRLREAGVSGVRFVFVPETESGKAQLLGQRNVSAETVKNIPGKFIIEACSTEPQTYRLW